MTKIKVLRTELTITEDECACTADIEVSNLHGYLKIGNITNNKIYENGLDTLYFCASENPLEILYDQSIEYCYELLNCVIQTKLVYSVEHPEFNLVIRKYDTKEEAESFCKDFPTLEINEQYVFVSGTIVD